MVKNRSLPIVTHAISYCSLSWFKLASLAPKLILVSVRLDRWMVEQEKPHCGNLSFYTRLRPGMLRDLLPVSRSLNRVMRFHLQSPFGDRFSPNLTIFLSRIRDWAPYTNALFDALPSMHRQTEFSKKLLLVRLTPTVRRDGHPIEPCLASGGMSHPVAPTFKRVVLWGDHNVFIFSSNSFHFDKTFVAHFATFIFFANL